jgi:hypothetical protein
MNLYGKIIGFGFFQLLAKFILMQWEVDKLLKLGLCERDTQINEILSTKVIGERHAIPKGYNGYWSIYVRV